jgi:hypothetical protein
MSPPSTLILSLRPHWAQTVPLIVMLLASNSSKSPCSCLQWGHLKFIVVWWKVRAGTEPLLSVSSIQDVVSLCIPFGSRHIADCHRSRLQSRRGSNLRRDLVLLRVLSSQCGGTDSLSKLTSDSRGGNKCQSPVQQIESLVTGKIHDLVLLADSKDAGDQYEGHRTVGKDFAAEAHVPHRTGRAYPRFRQ